MIYFCKGTESVSSNHRSQAGSNTFFVFLFILKRNTWFMLAVSRMVTVPMLPVCSLLHQLCSAKAQFPKIHTIHTSENEVKAGPCQSPSPKSDPR